MSTEIDLVAIELLQALAETPRQAPAMLAKETGLNHQQIKTTLRTLAELQLVKTPARGIYMITEDGRRHLQLLLQRLGERNHE